ncbi:unnamed protein product [Soboliphyme baturini]|uniref:RAB6-interacting golgin n=1 Tax=Soboliphyme baturini TaxID=241478 RepID=A0A183JAH1_9BILA|nr:unnamed protein product [Soboliphyme baturini]
MMEKEKEQLLRRTAKMKKKAAAMTGDSEALLKIASQLRREVERKENLKEYREEQRKQLLHIDQKLQRLQQKMNEISKEKKTLNPEELVAEGREEIDVLKYVLNEKMPSEREALDDAIQKLKEILALPSVQPEDLDDLRNKANIIFFIGI